MGDKTGDAPLHSSFVIHHSSLVINMALSLLIDHFDIAVRKPEDVARLKQLILQLAVRGRLVPQDPNDEPAEVILRRIAETKSYNLQEHLKVIEATNSTSSVNLPDSWVEVGLEPLVAANGLFTDGDWIESKDQDPKGEVRLVQLADVGDGCFHDKSNRYLTLEKATKLRCTFLETNDLLIARLPNPLGRACLFPGSSKKCITAVDICIYRLGNTWVDNNWLLNVLNSPYVREQIGKFATGTTRQRISRKNLAKIRFPLPPTAEQHRIVARVDELFALADAAAGQGAAAEAARERWVGRVTNYE